MAHWWNGSDKEKLKHSEKTLSQCHFVYHKYHMERPVTELGSPRRQTGDQQPEIRQGPQDNLKIILKKQNLNLPIPVAVRSKRRSVPA
jgi:hypothetical protein